MLTAPGPAASAIFAALLWLRGTSEQDWPNAAVSVASCPPREEILRSLELAAPQLRSDLRGHLRRKGQPGKLSSLAGQQGDSLIQWQDCTWAAALCRLRLPLGTSLLLLQPGLGVHVFDQRAAFPLGFSSHGFWVGSSDKGNIPVPPGAWADVEEAAIFTLEHAEVALLLPSLEADCREPLGLVPPYADTFKWAFEQLALSQQVDQLDVVDCILPLNYMAVNLYLALKHAQPADGNMDDQHANAHAEELSLMGWPHWIRQEWMLDLRKMSWDLMDIQGMKARHAIIPRGYELNDAVIGMLSHHVRQLTNFYLDLKEQPLFIPPAYPLRNVQGVISGKRKVPPRLRPNGYVQLDLIGAKTGLSVPAVGLHLTGLPAWRCHQATRWALELGIAHLHTPDGACWRAAAAALRSRWKGGKKGMFLSVSRGPMSTKHPDSCQLDLADLLLLTWDASEEQGLHQGGAAAAFEGCDFCDWSPYLSGTCVSQGTVVGHSAVGSSTGGVVVRLSPQHTYSVFPSLAPSEDPHLKFICRELGRSPSAVLAQLHLQEGRGVLLSVPGSRAELWRDLKQLHGFSLSRAHIQWLQELPGLAAGKIGQHPAQTMALRARDHENGGAQVRLNEVHTGSEDDAHGLGDMPTPSLHFMIEDMLEQSLRSILPVLRTTPCLRAQACDAGDADLISMVACMLKSFQPSADTGDPLTKTYGIGISRSSGQTQSLMFSAWFGWMSQKLAAMLPEMQRQLSYDIATRPPRFVVLDGLLPKDIVNSLQQELPQRPLCEVLAECHDGKAACDLRPGAHDFWRLSSPIDTPTAMEVNRFMLSDIFLEILQQATNRSLKPDVDFVRGNVLETLPSGYLGLHEDRSQRVRRQARAGPTPFEDLRLPRVNAIYFLHDLDEESAGHLELWSSDGNWPNPLPMKPAARVAVKSNRLVIFDTVDGIHGLPWPLTGKESRRVLQWYYVQADMGSHAPSLVEHNVPSSCGEPEDCYRDILEF
eukprot:TRINITY_DN7600_c0_g1_i1.p1 TRINITY_DN7600_c0_g1~~TRINITY_DN7600_c0_g1_i1.p1  ORF type:complete len:989 (+),score=146.40 TRINITY_DN7600_c0_g1_i1:43-3009(+)